MAKVEGGAAEVRERLRRVVVTRFGGSQTRFYNECGFARDTAQGWFRRSPRMPDTASLAIIAGKTGVSLDWLVLGRGPMKWPQGQDQLFAEVQQRLEREVGKQRASVLLGHWPPRPSKLWQEVVDFATDLVAEMYDSEVEE